ncbi:MAG: MFS transporter [Candidatus Tyrphobacter sp.]
MQSRTLTAAAPAPSPAARRALWAAGLGWGLDGFDFYLYVYALPGIMTAFSLTKAAGGLLATQMLVASAAGGIVMGVLADRIGRKRALVISIAWYAVFTTLCAAAQNYTQLAALRTLEGFGFGGEWAVGAVLAAEWSAPSRRGRSLGFMQSGWALGWLAANVAFQAVAVAVPAPYGWRALFVLGILPAFAVLYVRRAVADPPAYRVVRPPLHVTLTGMFSRRLARTTLLATLLAAGAQSGYYALFTWMPSYLSIQRKLPSLATGSYVYALIAGSLAGYVTAGFINDAIGRRATFVLFSVCSALMVPLYLAVVTANWELVPAGFALGYFASGIFSGFGPFLSELFPSDVRAAAQGFCYNAGRGVAGAAPYLVGVLAERVPVATAMIETAVAAYLVAVTAVLALPETKGRALEAPTPSPSCP